MAEAEIVQSVELLLHGWNTGSDIQLDHGSRPTASLLFGETLGVGHLPAILAIIGGFGPEDAAVMTQINSDLARAAGCPDAAVQSTSQ